MSLVNVNELELNDFVSPADPTWDVQVAFPMYAHTGSAASAVVYFEIKPGKRLGRHTDSGEEVLFIVAGQAEAEIGDQRVQVKAGDLALVPGMAPHALVNTGDETVRVVGFFAGSTLAHQFLEPFLPTGESVLFNHTLEGEEILVISASAMVPAVA